MLASGQLCPYWLLATLASDNHFGVLLLVETYKVTSELASDICTYVANIIILSRNPALIVAAADMAKLLT